MFSIGDKVVHPLYGAGTVVSIDRKQINLQCQAYYIIELLTMQGTLMVPVERADQVGLRYPVEKVETVIQILQSEPANLPNDHRERQDAIWSTIRTGDTVKISEVVRNLAWRDRESKLTAADAQLFQRAQEFLAGELALCQGVELEIAQRQVELALESLLPKIGEAE